MKNIPKVKFLDVPHSMFISTEMSHKGYHRLGVPECPICEIEKGDKNADKTEIQGRQEDKDN